MESIPQESLAPIKRRFVALCIDVGMILLLVVALAGWTGLAAVTQLGDPPGLSNSAALVIFGIVITIGIFGIGSFVWLIVVAGRGMSPGKQILGLCVVNLDGRTVTRGQMLLREALSKAPLLLILGGGSTGMLAFLPLIGQILPALRGSGAEILLLLAFVADNCWALRDASGQTVHDKIMRTLVVTRRTARAKTSEAQQSLEST